MEQIKGVYAACLSVLDENLALDVKNTIKHAENCLLYTSPSPRD